MSMSILNYLKPPTVTETTAVILPMPRQTGISEMAT